MKQLQEYSHEFGSAAHKDLCSPRPSGSHDRARHRPQGDDSDVADRVARELKVTSYSKKGAPWFWVWFFFGWKHLLPVSIHSCSLTLQ